MRVVVTGGAGQLGTLLLRRLAADPEIESLLSIDLQPVRVFHPKIRAVTADVRDPDFARHLHGCDAIVHLAFVITRRMPRQLVDDINVNGSKNVFRAAALAKMKSVVWSSSIAAYGIVPGHPIPIVEETPRRYQPELAYAATKFEVEVFLDRFEVANPELCIARLRPTMLVGPSLDRRLAAAWRRNVLPDAGGAPLTIVWEDDAVDAFVLALKKRARGAFVITAEGAMTPAELAKASGMFRLRIPQFALGVASQLSSTLERFGFGVATDPEWSKIGGVTLIASSARARNQLGWTPRFPTTLSVLKHFLATQVPTNSKPQETPR